MPLKSLKQLREATAQGPLFDETLLDELRADPRVGAQKLYQACLRRQARQTAEAARLQKMLHFERAAEADGFTCVAGVDEAGRGPLAGPIMAAAVVLAEPIIGLDDSKRLTATQREEIFGILYAGKHRIGIASLEPAEIDQLGIQPANYRVMAQAVAQLDPPPDFLLVDGFQLTGVAQPVERLVKGDQRSLSIAAASVVAKVTRDRVMQRLHKLYPEYGFGAHKGYGTKEHIEAIAKHGPSPVHRMTFAPIASRNETSSLF